MMTTMDAIPEGRTAGSDAAKVERIVVVDYLRGLVIIIMALDHVRDFFHHSGWAYNPIDFNQTNPVVYVTRWVTHLCAPTFVLLAGVSAYLQLAHGKALPKLSRFLLTRGLWLVGLELTVIGFALSFAVPYAFLLQVIWAIGWSMVALAGLVWVGPRACLALGLVIVVGHNLLDPLVPEQFGAGAEFWKIFHEGGLIVVGGQPIGFYSYPLLPWIGLMAVGYGLGHVFVLPQPQRDRTFILIGLGLLAVFAVLRGGNFYGDFRPWAVQEDGVLTAMDFFNVEKYPPSLLYLCATLGVVSLLVPAIARLKGRAANIIGAFGAVPLFAYVLHFYLAHTLAILWTMATGRDPAPYFGFLANAFANPDALSGMGSPLWVAYVAWVLVLAILYPACHWFAEVKRTRKGWWLSYL